jgi:hypothetical protein
MLQRIYAVAYMVAQSLQRRGAADAEQHIRLALRTNSPTHEKGHLARQGTQFAVAERGMRYAVCGTGLALPALSLRTAPTTLPRSSPSLSKGRKQRTFKFAVFRILKTDSEKRSPGQAERHRQR